MMNRILPLVLVLLGTISLDAGNLPGPAAQSAGVSLQTVEPFAYVCLTVKGSYAKIQQAVPNLMSEMGSQNTVPTGPLMGIYFNSPEQVEAQDLEWEVGFPVSPRQAVRPPLVLKEWSYTQVAACVHQGPYAEAPKTIIKITDWMEANGYAPDGPVLERYLDMNPSEMRPEDLRTEIWIPCKKK
jgi:AraC family transcriptional regulator